MKRKKQKHQKYIVTVTQDRLYKLVRDKYGATKKWIDTEYLDYPGGEYRLDFGEGDEWYSFILTILGGRGWLFRLVVPPGGGCVEETLEISHRELVERGILRRAEK